MKYTIACALAIATVSTIKISQKDIDMDPAKDAAYYPDHNTGNYTYSIKPNEYMGWNDGSYTWNFKTTGEWTGANRDTEHFVPAWELGRDTTAKEGGANHPKTEWGTEHKGYNHTASPIAHTDTYPIWQ